MAAALYLNETHASFPRMTRRLLLASVALAAAARAAGPLPRAGERLPNAIRAGVHRDHRRRLAGLAR